MTSKESLTTSSTQGTIWMSWECLGHTMRSGSGRTRFLAAHILTYHLTTSLSLWRWKCPSACLHQVVVLLSHLCPSPDSQQPPCPFSWQAQGGRTSLGSWQCLSVASFGRHCVAEFYFSELKHVCVCNMLHACVSVCCAWLLFEQAVEAAWCMA